MPIWEYGTTIGILSVVLPALLGLTAWVVKASIKSTEIARKQEADAQLELLNNRFEQLSREILSIKEILRERDLSCNQDHDKLADAVNRLNTNLSEVVGMFDFIINYFIKSGGK